MRVTYTAPNDSHSVLDSMTVTCAATSQTWVIPIAANAVPRQVAATALVLDKSGSMSEDRGDGLGTKIESLRAAAQVFVDVMLEGDAVSLVAFNQDAGPLEPLTALGDPTDPADPGRAAIAAAIAGPGLTPGGSTSIGDGINEGRLTLAGTTADVTSLVVLTDGKQNQPLWIADVAADIDEHTYAIGFGSAANTSVAELQTVAGNHGGYLLVTGPVTGDSQFVLEKYFLQVLAAISNAEVVLDPTNVLVPGQQHRIPLSLMEGDQAIDVILLADGPDRLRFRLQTPNGDLIDPDASQQLPGVRHITGAKVAYYRLTLPVEVRRRRPEREGTWHAIVEHSDRDPPDDSPRSRRVSYSIIVHAWSDLAFTVDVRQDHHDPGASASITATLANAGGFVESAQVWAEITSPRGDVQRLPLDRTNGTWNTAFRLEVAGTYAVRARAAGTSRKGAAYHRERTLTASVWHGGERDLQSVNRSTRNAEE